MSCKGSVPFLQKVGERTTNVNIDINKYVYTYIYIYIGNTVNSKYYDFSSRIFSFEPKINCFPWC